MDKRGYAGIKSAFIHIKQTRADLMDTRGYAGIMSAFVHLVRVCNPSVTGGDDVILEESFFNSALCLITKKMLPA
jgi:hypothetical protein